jgi:hypothetical protein
MTFIGQKLASANRTRADLYSTSSANDALGGLGDVDRR